MAKQETTLVFNAVDKVTPVLRGIEGQIKGLGTAFGAAAAGGIAALGATIVSTIKSLDELGDQAKALNITTEALSGLGFAAQQSGSSAETLNAGLTRLNKTLGDAANGNKQAASLFESLGISIRNAQGQVISADAALLRVADRFESYQDGAQEAAIATALFGRSAGPELVQFLNRGSEGIAALTDEARELGIVVGGDASEAAGAFNDNIDKLKAAGTGFANALTTALLPALTEFSNEAVEAAKQGGILAEIGTAIGNEFTAFSVDLVNAKADIQQLAAELANAAQFISDWAENLGVAGKIAVASFQTIQLATQGNFEVAAAGLDAIGKAVEFLGAKAAADAAKRMGDLSSSISSIRDDAAKKIDRIRSGVDGLAKSAKPAAAGVGLLPPPLIKTGAEAEKAGKKLSQLAKLTDDLKFSLEQMFRDGLKPATEAMQEFDVLTGRLASTSVPDIELAITSASSSFEGFGNVVTVEAEAFQQNWEGATNAATDAFADFISGNIESFEDFGDALESIAKQFLSNLVRQFLSTNLQVGGGGIGGLGSLLGGGGGSGSSGAGGGLLGGAGSFLQFGLVIGAVIGGLASALKDDTRRLTVIGDDVVGTRGFRNLAPGSTFESQLGGFTFASLDNVTADERSQIGQSVVNFDNTIAALLDADQLGEVTEALSTFNLRLEEGAISAENILGQRFDAILSTFDQDVQDFVNGATTLEERVQRLADEINRPILLDQLLDSLEEVNTNAGLSQFDLALRQLNAEFDAAAAAATELRATQEQLARIEVLRGEAIDRLTESQRRNLDALLDDLRFDDATEGLSDVDVAIAGINREFDDLRERAIALGATQEDLDLIERRRTAALLEATEATRDSVDAIEAQGEAFRNFADQAYEDYLNGQAFERQFLDGLTDALQNVRDYLNGGSSVSSLNPLERLQQSQAQFEDLARRASFGDMDAIRGIAGGADRFLQQAAQFYGVGSADFQRYEALVRSTLTPLSNVDTTQSVAVALAGLRAVYEALMRFLQGGNGANGVNSAATMQQIATSLARLAREPARAN